RLQKLISQAQIASRRAAEEMIRAGRVTVDGRVAQLGDKADPAVQDVRVDGRRLAAAPDYVYILLYKPRGVVSSNKREAHEKRPLVRSLIPHEGHLFTVGRLDADSEGLILLTNDGALADRLMHPKYGHAKTYEVLVEGQPSRATLDKWRQGVPLGDEVSAPAKVRVLEVKPNETWIQVIMREGRKRQIRRIASQLGHPVKRLIRTQIEMLTIGRLQPGEWRKLSPREVRKLKGE
ncbi:MAG: pseudouridine synthase, partial [Chloroflexota bacterium]